MPHIHLIAVGRLREPHWKAAAAAYAKRLRQSCDLVEIEVKDGDPTLSPADRTALEGDRILRAVKGAPMLVCLDEHGETPTSTLFAQFLKQCFDTAITPCFIIGGPYGLAKPVKERAAKLISFSPMTFPHELARVVLLEQLYRADTIMRGRPYHHE